MLFLSFIERLFGKKNEKEPEPDPEPPVYVVDTITVNVISDLSPDGDPRATVSVKDFELIIVVHGEKILENLAQNMAFTLGRDCRKRIELQVREELAREILQREIPSPHSNRRPKDVFIP